MNTAPTKTNTAPRRASPMRVIRQWLFGERALRGPAAIELDVVDHQITREETAVRTCAEQAGGLTVKLTGARAELAAAMADGVVDSKEAEGFARTLMGVSIDANRHRKDLEALT